MLVTTKNLYVSVDLKKLFDIHAIISNHQKIYHFNQNQDMEFKFFFKNDF